MATVKIDSIKHKGTSVEVGLIIDGLNKLQAWCVKFASFRPVWVFTRTLFSARWLSRGWALFFGGFIAGLLTWALTSVGMSENASVAIPCVLLSVWLVVSELMMLRTMYFWNFWFRVSLVACILYLLIRLAFSGNPERKKDISTCVRVNFDLLERIAIAA